MGFLKKVFKGVKKVAKKIGKGIKKIAKKVAGALGKIGPIGQLALMFIGVPPILGRVFGAVGSFVQSVAPNVYKAFSAIKTAGQGAFNTITEAIGNGVDRVMNFTKGKGFTLSGDRTSIFGGVSAKDIPTPTSTEIATTASQSGVGPQIPDVSDVIEGDLFSTPIDTSIPSLDAPASKSLLSPDITAEAVNKYGPNVPDVSGIADSKLSFGIDKKASETILGGIKQNFTKENIGRSLGSAGLDIIKQRATVAGMDDLPTQMHLDLGQFIMPTSQIRPMDSTDWSSINKTYQQAGAFGGAAHGDFMTPIYNQTFEDDNQYKIDMQRLGGFITQ